MRRIKNSIALVCLTLLAVGFMASCSKMKVGYLRTAGASFAPDFINVFHNIDPTSTRYLEQEPFVSTSIQGVAGTNPVNFELASVKADTPAAGELFMKLYKEGEISVVGGKVIVSLKATQQLTNGRYHLTLKVYNEDHEALLENIFTVVVTDDELAVN